MISQNKSIKMFLLITGMLILIACQFLVRPYESGDVLFADDFSKSNKNWKTWDTPGESAVSIFENGLIMIVKRPNLDLISTNLISFPNVSIQTTAKKRYGTNDNAYGIVCRYFDDENYYGFLISSDGYYGIVKVVEGRYDLLSSEYLEYDEDIHKDSGDNLLTAVCDKNKLSFSINGVVKAGVIDNDLRTGKTGLITGTFSESMETAVLFDNFIVAVP